MDVGGPALSNVVRRGIGWASGEDVNRLTRVVGDANLQKTR